MSKPFKIPFGYLGSKRRYWEKFIEPEFLKSGKKRYVDPFAGSLVIPLTIKKHYKDVYTDINVFDMSIETMLKSDMLDEYLAFIAYMFNNGVKEEPSRLLHKNDETAWIKAKATFFKWKGGKVCEHCGHIINKKEMSKKQRAIAPFITFGITGESLGGSYYSEIKLKKIYEFEKFISYIDFISYKSIKDWFKPVENSFVFLDPPYIQSIKIDQGEMIGSSYAAASEGYSNKEDRMLIEWIKENRETNTFYLCGSIGNNLYKLLNENFKDIEFKEIRDTKTIYGKKSEVAEYHAILR